MKPTKWTQDIRRVVYKRLKDEFGPCSDWHSRTNPTGNIEDLDKVLADIAIGLSYLTGKDFTAKEFDKKGDKNPVGQAVLSQINWGIQKNQSKCTSLGMMANFILNRAIALEVGLIESSDLPNYALFDKIPDDKKSKI